MAKKQDARGLVEQVRAASSPEQRRELVGRYNLWLAAGAKAQGVLRQAGLVLFPVGVFAAILMMSRGMKDWLLYALCVIAAAVGIWCMQTAARRERAWRRANPFDGWKP